MKNCPVIGSRLQFGCRVGEETRELILEIKDILQSLGIEEDNESTEPTLYLKRSCKLDSTSVLTMKNKKQTLRNMFNVFYYNSLQCKYKSRVGSFRHVSISKLCDLSYQRFISKFKTVTISNLEKYFSNIRAKFYFKSIESNKLKPCKFSFDKNENPKFIFLVYIIGHYLVAPRSHHKKWVKIGGLTSSWCSICSAYYNNLYNHAKICSQNNICKMCLSNCCTSRLSRYQLSCKHCHFKFRSVRCFNFHRGTTCKKVYLCHECGQYVNTYVSNSKHDCTSTKCGVCQRAIPKDDYTHQCLIRKIKEKQKLKKYIFVYYDFECYRNKENYESFVPCLVAAHTACNVCTLEKPETVSNEEQKCRFCRSIKVDFLGTSCVQEFVDFLLRLELEFGDGVNTIYAIALNAGRFDSWFIYNYILSNSHLLDSPPLMRCNKILMLPLSKKVRCIDALMFVPMALAKYEKNFELNVAKSPFPHDWFTMEIFFKNFVKFPLFSDFAKGDLTYAEYQSMKKKYCELNDMFSIHEMLRDYCHTDVAVLRAGFSKYIKIIYDKFKLHPLENTVTLSSVTWKLYKTWFIPDNLYALDSIDIFANNSKLQYEVLYYIKTLLRGTEFELITQREKLSPVNVNIEGKSYATDGLIRHKNSNQVLALVEVNGCYFHEHILGTNNPCPLNNTRSSHKYWLTKKRKKKLEQFKPVIEVWECKWKEIRNRHEQINALIDEFRMHLDLGGVSPRGALFGGCCEVLKRHHLVQRGETLHFRDVVSLYPSVQLYNEFGVGPFKVLYGFELPGISSFIDIMRQNPNVGMALVTVSPPARQLYPTLPFKIDGVLCLALCPKCAEFFTFPCAHTQEECYVTGTYTYVELLEAVDSGYTIVELHEMLFCEQSSKIFEKAITTIAALKIAYSGWPSHVTTDEQKRDYVESFRAQGIKIVLEDFQQSSKSSVTIWKILLNALWGRLAFNKARYKSLGIAHMLEELIALYKSEGKHKIENLVNSIKSEKVLYQYTEEKPKKTLIAIYSWPE